jgi:transcriptional regulator with XRE-family HTH domain
MILRLLAKAQAGVKCDVSMVDALDFRREQYGLSWAEFGMMLGLSAQHMSEVKNGKRRLPIGALKRAYAIGVPADALLQHLTDNVAGNRLAEGKSELTGVLGARNEERADGQ